MVRYERYGASVAAVVLALGGPLAAIGHAAAPVAPSDVSIPFLEQTPFIDGVLDERAWQEAVVLDGFVQTRPGDNTPPSKPTSVDRKSVV